MFRTHSNSVLHNRKGLIALNEILIVVAILAAMFWLVSQFMETVTNEPRVAKPKVGATSDRCVYRISLDRDHEQLRIYRPRDGLTLLNLETGEVEQSVPLPQGLAAVAHSGDGQATIFCGFDGMVVLNRTSETPVSFQLVNAMDMVVDAAVSNSGETAVCCTMLGQIHGWNKRGEELREFQYKLPAGANVARVGLNKTGDRMFVGRYDGTVLFIDPVTGVLDSPVLRIDPKSRGECFAYTWSDDERLLASISADCHVRVYDVASRHLVIDKNLQDGMNGRPTAIVLSHDGMRLAIATSFVPIVQVWNVASGKLEGELKGHKGIIRTLQFADSSTLYSGSYDGTVREWSLDSWTQSRVVD